MTNEDAGDLVRQQFFGDVSADAATVTTDGGEGVRGKMENTNRLLETSRALLATCLDRGSGDNMTVLVIGLGPPTVALRKTLFDNWAS